MTPTHPERECERAEDGQTSYHIRRAGAGEETSVAWVVARFTPFLQAQAEYRLRGPLRKFCEPTELVDEVWAAVLPRLSDLRSREERWTPVLLRFLGTTLLNKINQVLTQVARASWAKGAASESSLRGGVEQLSDPATSVLGEVLREEACRLLREAIERLDPAEREILVLRGIEQLPHAEIASFLNENVGAVTMRYHRTLEKLRTSLKGSILDELPGS